MVSRALRPALPVVDYAPRLHRRRSGEHVALGLKTKLGTMNNNGSTELHGEEAPQ